ncbi:MAG: TetR/AcrR family transcriptional regulator [Gordonia sp. (in: high G+C Gram-positive bacteria)]
MRPAEPGRTALLDAGSALLAEADLPKLSVNAVVARAGMAKGSFYQHWPARRDYLVALHRRFHDGLAEFVVAAMEGAAPGLPRIEAGMTAYLDGCLANPATKGLLVQARTDSDLGPEVVARNSAFAEIAVDELVAAGWEDPEPIATLFIAMVAETALAELSDAAARPDLRAAVLRLVSVRAG